mmetsp:Transcript_4319/g.10969  ORF Transcript_4319/g.10969 Transcript_4319/m.10969 type:complete len:232 (+) Transcript_4319:513-1208(+)
MQKDRIPFLGIRNHLLIRSNDVISIRLGMFSVVHEDHDVLLLETVDVHNVFLHVENIVPATTKFPRAVTNIVDANHHCPLGTPFVSVWHQVELGIDIKRIHRGKLRDLRITTAPELHPHLLQHFGKAQIFLWNLLIGIKDVEQRRSACSPSTTGRIGKLERSHVRNIRGRLLILTPADHANILAQLVRFCGLELLLAHLAGAIVVALRVDPAAAAQSLHHLRLGLFEGFLL